VLAGASSACSQRTPPDARDEIVDFRTRSGQHTRSVFRSAVRGWVPFSVYLPPGWTADGHEAYPLIVLLHGQGGDERAFARAVPAAQLNEWIASGAVPPFVAIAVRGADDLMRVQWHVGSNVRMLASQESGELRAYARERFSAGLDPATVSIHGQSRGATGALYLALAYPRRFASAVATSLVSDYALGRLKAEARRNRDLIIESGIDLRLSIGTEDEYVIGANRIATAEIHGFFTELAVPHEYELVPGVGHSFVAMWNAKSDDGKPLGLVDLQFHARAWLEAAASPGPRR
jgi:enterochelin esterase-like enzyme